MKKIFWTTIFWVAIVAGFLGYLRWFDQPLAQDISLLILKTQCSTVCSSVNAFSTSLSGESMENSSGTITLTPVTLENQGSFSGIDTKLEDIKAQLKDINEKLDIQNSNTPDAVSVSLKTTKKTNVWIFPLDGGDYKKYILPASDDILKDALNLLFDKSPFALADTKLDNDGNLTLVLQRVPGSAFGGSAAVETAKNAIEKTALQFPQIKKVIITPEEILQP